MAFRVVPARPALVDTRPHEPDEPARHVAEVSDWRASRSSAANVWRYEPGAKGSRHRQKVQEETFVVLAGTLSMYVGEPPERHDVPPGGVVHVEPRTAVQSVNHGDVDLLVYIHGWPPETERADLLDSAL